jgi:hypothetical protein
MSISARVSRHIRQLKGEEPFSIRDFLHYGTRGAVDQAFYRLVKAGRLKRIAQGIFIKPHSAMPSTLAVAKLKATSFGKTIAMHGSKAAQYLGIAPSVDGRLVYAVVGSTSSFRFSGSTIHMRSTSARKMHFEDEIIGLAIRGLWHLGRSICTEEIACMAVSSFNRLHRETFRQSANKMPAWMQKLFPSIRRGLG